MLTLEHKHAITEAVRQWIDDKNPARSGNKLAERSNVSNAYISKIKAGQYEYDLQGDRSAVISDAVFHRLADALGIRFDGQLHWPFINSFKLLNRVCKKAQKTIISKANEYYEFT